VEGVYLFAEVWLNPGVDSRFKAYRQRTLDIVLADGAELVYSGHPFAALSGAFESGIAHGVQVLRFPGEAAARAALAEIERTIDADERAAIFAGGRSFLSRFEQP
jgi:hypothetical protein